MSLNRLMSIWMVALALLLGGCASAGGMAKSSAPMAADAASPGDYGGEGAMADEEMMAGAPPPPPAPMAPAEDMLEVRRESSAGVSGRMHKKAMKDDRVAQAGPPEPEPAPNTQAPPPGPTGDTTEKPEPPPSTPDAKVAGPLLIYEADLNMAVFETEKSIDTVERLALDSGGYLVIRTNEQITIRVPAEKFQDVMKKVTAIGDVTHRNVSVRDVTEEYYDVLTRLRNQEAVLKRLQELLAKAQGVEEALAVERELARVAEEVERMKGRLKVLRELVAFSTITVTFAARQTEQVGTNVDLPFYWLNNIGLGRLLDL